MPDTIRDRVALDIPWRTIFKLIAAVVLVWLWVQLWQLVLLLVIAVLLAVTLDPIVRWLERRGMGRGGASTLVSFCLFGMLVLFLYFSWSSIADQAQLVGNRLTQFEQSAIHRMPPGLVHVLGLRSGGELQQTIGPYVLRMIRSAGEAVVVVVLAFILMLYLLIEGKRTYRWLLAFVPERRREKVNATAVESQRVIFGYVAGNIATSIFATVFVLVSLSILGVPAAFFLALVAGICDFVPVLGFIASAIPAVLLGLTKSPTTALVVIILYVAYHVTENYFIAPKVYGDRLRLSDVAVVLAFAVGAELAGVVGAVIALPLAAVYPAIERIWLRERVGDKTVNEHRKIERRKAG